MKLFLIDSKYEIYLIKFTYIKKIWNQLIFRLKKGHKQDKNYIKSVSHEQLKKSSKIYQNIYHHTHYHAI